MSTMYVQPSLMCAHPQSIVSKNTRAPPALRAKPKSFLDLKVSRVRRLPAAAATAAEFDVSQETTAQESEKLQTVVGYEEKKGGAGAGPRLVLRFIWMEKNIGVALDQVIAGHGSVPLSPYYFWPRKDAWEELRTTLESKPWISQKNMIILLNQATDIINLWQQSGANLS